MVKVANPHGSIGLPKEVLSRLDPRLAELYTQLPPVLAARISVLVRQALPQRIHPNRVLRFAYLYATAERSARGDPVSKEHTRRAKLELAGTIHELQTGYRDDVEAQQRYRRGRRARQQIKSSIDSVQGKWLAFEQLAQKLRPELPVHAQSKISDPLLQEIRKLLHGIGNAIVLDEADLAKDEVHERKRSDIAQAYIWWHLLMASYRGKWNDMHRLAVAWRMSDAASVKRFSTVVYRHCKGASWTYPFETSWESLLSEKS
jgi:hypothetical protein